MTSANLDKGDWVIVCDGRKAIILENTGDAEAYSPAVRRAVVREIAKGAVKPSVHEIEHAVMHPV